MTEHEQEQARLQEAAELALAEHGTMKAMRDAVEAEREKIQSEKKQKNG